MAKKILFQGDSITDASRSRDNDFLMGCGYPTMVAGDLGKQYPARFEFINRGISGDRAIDIYARIKADIINEKPDYMSLLVGVNDVWHEIMHQNGVAADKYERVYDWLIGDIREALPSIGLLLLEPFCLPAKSTCNTEEYPTRWEYFKSETALRAAAVKRVAEKYGVVFVPLQHLFDKACETAEPAYWLYDGVHPTAMGHCLIKEAWMSAFEKHFL